MGILQYTCDRIYIDANRMELSSLMRAHGLVQCEDGQGSEPVRRRCLDCPDPGPAVRTPENRARVPRGEASASCLVRRALGARPRRRNRTSAVRDRATDADRAVQYFQV